MSMTPVIYILDTDHMIFDSQEWPRHFASNIMGTPLGPHFEPDPIVGGDLEQHTNSQFYKSILMASGIYCSSNK
jgi:hypothetical protein